MLFKGFRVGCQMADCQLKSFRVPIPEDTRAKITELAAKCLELRSCRASMDHAVELYGIWAHCKNS